MRTIGVWEKGSRERETEPESVYEVAIGLRWR